MFILSCPSVDCFFFQLAFRITGRIDVLFRASVSMNENPSVAFDSTVSISGNLPRTPHCFDTCTSSLNWIGHAIVLSCVIHNLPAQICASVQLLWRPDYDIKKSLNEKKSSKLDDQEMKCGLFLPSK